MTSSRLRACVIVPCFNEARRIDTGEFNRFLSEHRDIRILFVDDGSLDSTLQVLDDLCRSHVDRTGIVRNSLNRGKAEAVRVGILHALEHFEQDFVGYWDADLATPLESVQRFISVLDSHPGIEMVFGSRVQLLGRDIQRRPARHYLGRVFATVVSTMLHLPVYDTQCGAKLFRANSRVKEIYSEPFLSRWVFDVEIIARYLNQYQHDHKRLEKVIYEYPLERWIDVKGSKLRPKDFLSSVIDLLRIRRRYL